ncbi:MAG: PASTA domain-containing protein [Bacilli bacterium]|nr:PASTA domain-containing protein [Bacilli bacterium]
MKKKVELLEEEQFKVKKSVKIVLVIFLILALISSGVSIFDLYLLRSLESFQKYIYVAIFILVFLDALFFIKVGKRFGKKVKKRKRPLKSKALITFLILYFLIMALFAGIATYAYLFLGSFNKDTVTYSSSLVVMSENEATDIKDIKNYNIGILKDKQSAEGYIIPQEVIKEKKLEDYNNIKKYNNYSSMIADLYSGDVDAIFISSNYVSMFTSIEAYQNIESDTKVVYEQEKKMKKVSSQKQKKKSSTKKVSDPFTILLMGVDTTEEGLSKNTVANGDSLILITFDPTTLNATMLSIPRDSYVPIACWSNKAENKITHAAGYGSECMINTIENYFDVTIDYYAKINFKGLVHLVDALGGIDVEVPKDLCTDDSSRTEIVCIQAGMQHLNGEGALVLARNRKQLSGGDLDRGQNQQLVIKALLNKARTIRSASKFLEVLNTISNNLDTNFTTDQILSFYNIAEDILNNHLAKDDGDLVNIQQLYLQGTGQMIYDESMKMVLWNYIPNKESRNDIIKAMKTNLRLLDHENIKEFSFSINEEYEKEIIGYGPYKKDYSYALVPNFVGYSKDVATSIANRNGIKVSFSGNGGLVVSQSIPAGKRVDKFSGTVTLTLSGSSNSSNDKKDNNDNKNNTTKPNTDNDKDDSESEDKKPDPSEDDEKDKNPDKDDEEDKNPEGGGESNQPDE